MYRGNNDQYFVTGGIKKDNIGARTRTLSQYQFSYHLRGLLQIKGGLLSHRPLPHNSNNGVSLSDYGKLMMTPRSLVYVRTDFRVMRSCLVRPLLLRGQCRSMLTVSISARPLSICQEIGRLCRVMREGVFVAALWRGVVVSELLIDSFC